MVKSVQPKAKSHTAQFICEEVRKIMEGVGGEKSDINVGTVDCEMSAGYCALSMTGSSWIMTCTVCDPECQTSAYKRKQQLDRHTWP